MPDMAAISAAFSSLKSAIDIAKAMNDLRNWSAAQPQIIELNRLIIDAQASLSAADQERTTLIKRIRQLEQRLAEKEAWSREKQRYQLTDVGDGNFAYIVKPDDRGSEPPHYVCANCYSDGKASLLHHLRTPGMGDLLTCNACKSKMLIDHGYRAPA